MRSSGAAGYYPSTGAEILTSTPAELAAFQAVESHKWGCLIKAAGIEPEPGAASEHLVGR
ncbi:MAG: hypothetical protein I8H71_05950 [Xanthomonadaceae bacterium]|nr:hypothetical protein [Xanthomonadaceae bacterium]